MKTKSLPAATVARRLLDARAAYDAACAGPATVDFGPIAEALHAATAAFSEYRCKSIPDLAAYASALWWHIENEQRDAEQFGDDAAGPLIEFFPVADAVRREFVRLMGLPASA